MNWKTIILKILELFILYTPTILKWIKNKQSKVEETAEEKVDAEAETDVILNK